MNEYMNRLPVIDRAGGVLLGMGVSDGWSTATNLALCVADAAATGIALTEAASLDLLRRNLRELQVHDPAARAPYSHDQILAVSTAVALAYLHDPPAHRADATRAVLEAMGEHARVDGSLLHWVDLVADVVRTGIVDDEAVVSGARDMDGHVRAAVDVVRHVEFTDGDDTGRVEAGLEFATSAPAATGALLGARFGWRAMPKMRADQTRGWPDANWKALVGLGLLAARSQPRWPASASDTDGLSGYEVPVERWDDISAVAIPSIPSGGPDDGIATGPSVWRRTQVALTAADAETGTAA